VVLPLTAAADQDVHAITASHKQELIYFTDKLIAYRRVMAIVRSWNIALKGRDTLSYLVK
jgi:hypothetical protein